MKTVSIIGSVIVTIALVFYSAGFITENRKRLVTGRVIFFYTIGVSLDITATVLMILGSSKGFITPHGMIGYSSLLGMLIDTALLWRHYLSLGPSAAAGRSLHLYSRIAFIWWIMAYITGGLLVAISKIQG